MNQQELQNNIPDSPIKKPAPKGRLIFLVLTSVFCLVIFGVGAVSFVMPDRDYSESENRVLASMPEISLFSLTEGTFMKNFETYFTDQFIFRDEIISFKTFCDRLIGKKQVGGVYIGKDGYLFSRQSDFNQQQVKEITDAVSAFAEKYKTPKITFAVSPNSSFINSDKLPDNLTLENQSYQIKDIQDYTESQRVGWVNLSDAFTAYKNKDKLFYKTDHHWTSRAAFEAFRQIMLHWNKNTAGFYFDFFPVTHDFQGTLSSKSGITSAEDIIEICVPRNTENTYIVSYDSLEKKTATFFDENALKGKNKYEVFLGANTDKITVTTTSVQNDTLLIIKDSYANCTVPMFMPYFSKIVVVDPRYLKGGISDIMEENSFTHVLFLYNLNTLLEDTSLATCITR